MELKCYVYPGWRPRIRASSPRRDWMDATPESFAYRCLPLAIANAHGWEILSPCGFKAKWNGGSRAEDVIVIPDPGTAPDEAPVALFGQGTVTFHVAGLFRTDPGCNLWVGGPPNFGKDAIVPLSGVIETDWSPYSFTMNWRFTRPGQWVRFEENEPFAFFFPIERGMIEAIEPRFLPIESEPELKAQFETWSQSRNAFHQAVSDLPALPSQKWQKLYYRGVDAYGRPGPADHQSKLRVQEFGGELKLPIPVAKCPVSHGAPRRRSDAEIALAKRDWILQTQERLRSLSPAASDIMHKEGISAQEFLDQHYAANHPVVLGGEIDDWPALSRWTPEYLKARIDSSPVEVQGDRDADPDFERDKNRHRQTMPFDAFIDGIARPGNSLYMTAYNSAANQRALAPLHDDVGFIGKLLDPDAPSTHGMMWIGPSGSFTPLHHDLTNNLLVQVRGRKRIVLASPRESGRLYNDLAVFSRIRDVRAADPTEFPLLPGIRLYELLLEAGDALFIPVGWWHQVTAIDFSISITYTNFRWPNDAYDHYPGDQ